MEKLASGEDKINFLNKIKVENVLNGLSEACN